MKTTKLSHVFFVFAVIAALVLAAVPITPAHALSTSPAAQGTSITSTAQSSLAPAASVLVCRSATFWRHGHRITVRVCHRVHKDPKS